MTQLNNKSKSAVTPNQKRQATLILKKIKKENAAKKPVSQSNELTIRNTKIQENFQRYCVVVSMFKDGKSSVDILDRLMAENGIYAGTNKAMSEKTTKALITKVKCCMKALNGHGQPSPEKPMGTLVYHAMHALKEGKTLPKSCTFKSNANLIYNAITER